MGTGRQPVAGGRQLRLGAVQPHALDAGRQPELDSGPRFQRRHAQQHIAYSPFGQQIVTAAGAFSTEAVAAFGYTGAYTDVVTGDVHNGVRWSTPRASAGSRRTRFADENLYRYCGNGPTDGTDPSGLDANYTAIGATCTLGVAWVVHQFVPQSDGYVEYSVGGQTMTASFATSDEFANVLESIAKLVA